MKEWVIKRGNDFKRGGKKNDGKVEDKRGAKKCGIWCNEGNDDGRSHVTRDN